MWSISSDAEEVAIDPDVDQESPKHQIDVQPSKLARRRPVLQQWDHGSTLAVHCSNAVGCSVAVKAGNSAALPKQTFKEESTAKHEQLIRFKQQQSCYTPQASAKQWLILTDAPTDEATRGTVATLTTFPLSKRVILCL